MKGVVGYCRKILWKKEEYWNGVISSNLTYCTLQAPNSLWQLSEQNDRI